MAEKIVTRKHRTTEKTEYNDHPQDPKIGAVVNG